MQYVVSLTVRLETEKTCPEQAKIDVYARRDQEKIILFGKTVNNCEVTFENKNEDNRL